MERCVVIGASPLARAEAMCSLIRPEDYIICADGGIRAAAELSLKVDLIVGDFDSWPSGRGPNAFQDTETIRLPVKKNETDMQYAVEEGLRRGFRNFLLLGGLGGRLDHTLANIATLAYLREQEAIGVLADEQHTLQIGRDETLRFDNREGQMLSIFPYGCSQCIVSGRGVLYSLESLTLHASFPLGVSNRIIAPRCSVTIEQGTALFSTVSGEHSPIFLNDSIHS